MSAGRKNTVSRLKHRVTLQEEAQIPDGQGGYVRSWEDVAALWAEILPVSGAISRVNAELFASGQIQSRLTHRITLRYRAGVHSGMRLVFDDRAFNIRSVVNVEERNEVLEIIAEEGVAT